jgi:hypothetical protein
MMPCRRVGIMSSIRIVRSRGFRFHVDGPLNKCLRVFRNIRVMSHNVHFRCSTSLRGCTWTIVRIEGERVCLSEEIRLSEGEESDETADEGSRGLVGNSSTSKARDGSSGGGSVAGDRGGSGGGSGRRCCRGGGRLPLSGSRGRWRRSLSPGCTSWRWHDGPGGGGSDGSRAVGLLAGTQNSFSSELTQEPRSALELVPGQEQGPRSVPELEMGLQPKQTRSAQQV